MAAFENAIGSDKIVENAALAVENPRAPGSVRDETVLTEAEGDLSAAGDIHEGKTGIEADPTYHSWHRSKMRQSILV